MSLALLVLDDVGSWPWRIALLLGGVLLNGVATALYLGSAFRSGARDGLMTGLVRRTGRSVRLVRTVLEVTVLAVGWLLGGTVGVGTVLYVVAIGPVAHALLPVFTVRPPDAGGEAVGSTP